MPEHIQALMAIQGTLTAASGGFNAVYFVGYSASHPARKIAARVLLLVNLSFPSPGAVLGRSLRQRLFQPRPAPGRWPPLD